MNEYIKINPVGGSGGGGVTYPILAPDGTVLAPSYSFTNFPSSGMLIDGIELYMQNAGNLWVGNLTVGETGLYVEPLVPQVGLYVNNVTSLLADPAGIKVPDGAVDTPSYSFINAPTSGIWLDSLAEILMVRTDASKNALIGASAQLGLYSDVGDTGGGTWSPYMQMDQTGIQLVSTLATEANNFLWIRSSKDSQDSSYHETVYLTNLSVPYISMGYLAGAGPNDLPIYGFIKGFYGDLELQSATGFKVTTGNVVQFQVDNSVTAGDTRMLLWDVDNGTLSRVSVGADDSGGVGYKVLRIPN